MTSAVVLNLDAGCVMLTRRDGRLDIAVTVQYKMNILLLNSYIFLIFGE